MYLSFKKRFYDSFQHIFKKLVSKCLHPPSNKIFWKSGWTLMLEAINMLEHFNIIWCMWMFVSKYFVRDDFICRHSQYWLTVERSNFTCHKQSQHGACQSNIKLKSKYWAHNMIAARCFHNVCNISSQYINTTGYFLNLTEDIKVVLNLHCCKANWSLSTIYEGDNLNAKRFQICAWVSLNFSCT